ncbi:MAG: DNA polymerase III subunit alpha [Candidatus Rokubacteria bacterium]|nr:DNA polymerase III subunit alpha [Candidatus Rokubacteria bacterium]
MRQPADFVHLHVHSEYSLLDGAAHLRRLVERASQLGFPALALTDHGNLFGVMDFYSLAREAGVKPILGAELYVAPASRFEKAPLDGQYEGANHVTVLVRNEIGYRNLIKLVSKGYLEGFYYKPRVDKELLARHADGLLVLSGCLNSEVSRLLLAGEERKARDTAGWYADVFGRDDYFMEVQSHGLPDQLRLIEGVGRLAQALGVGIVGTNDSHYLEAADARAHEVLLCLQTGTKLSDPNRWRFATEEFYLKSAEEMRKVFAELPEAYANTMAVAERCTLELTFDQFHLPRYEVPSDHTLDSYLRELAYAGLQLRYPAPGTEVVARLEHELEIIRSMKFSGYFLVVWDFIKFAKERGIAVGPGRGSAAGSLVAYCLGITNIDPLHYGLLFERFLNPGRKSMPDMDIDFADDRRDEVIRYVEQRYGRDRVAQIITFNVLKAKAVIRDVGRVVGMPFGEVDRIAKLVPDTLNITLDDALRHSPPLAEAVKTRPEVAELWQIAKRLEGLARHAGKHAAGVVISDEPLIERVPLYKDPKGEEVITQYAMGPIEKLGLLKMDFLGLRTLTVIANTVQLVEESRGIRIDLERLPLDDPKTYQLLSDARTFGVFQLESAGMREALRQLRPERLEDVIAMVALYRPGPMQMIPEFTARRHGLVKPTYEHPLMEKHLRATYGIMVYQEQVMQIASELAGFTMSEADDLRTAMGKKRPEIMAARRAKFIAGATARGVKPKVAERVFDLMEKFAGYGFNKSHAAAYAIVAYQTAYLKANYPVEFMGALLTSEMANTDKVVVHIEECRAMGIEVSPPDVNVSGFRFGVAGEAIRFGLGAIKNLGEKAIESIVRARERGGPFTSLADFSRRVDLQLVNRRVVESLIKAGAFDVLGYNRAQLLAGLDTAFESGQRHQRERDQGQVSIFDLMGGGAPVAEPASAEPRIPEWDQDQLLRYEKEVLGFYLSGHPLKRVWAEAQRLGGIGTGDLASREDGSRVVLCGLVGAIREINTKNGDRMAFATLEDMDGAIELTIFPETFRQSGGHLRSGVPLLVRGRVEGSTTARKLLAEDIRPLRGEEGAGASAPSACRVWIATATRETLQALRAICDAHPGPVPVHVHLEVGGAEVVVRSRTVSVRPSPPFAAAVEGLLGGRRVRVE